LSENPDIEKELDLFHGYVESFVMGIDGVRNLSPNTARAYSTDLAAFESWLSRTQTRPLEITHAQLRSYLGELTRARYSPRTISRHLSSLRGLYRWMNQRGACSGDAAAAVASPKLARGLPRTLEDSEVIHMMETCDEKTPQGLRDLAMLELMYASGARISEVSALNLNSVDVAQGQVRLFGKGSKERIVPLYERALDAVDRYVREGRPELLAMAKRVDLDGKRALFVSTRGRRMSPDALRTAFESHARAAGLDSSVTPHAMRHTFATELLSGGADLRSVQELLGHADLSTTQVYTHLSVERLKQAARSAHPRS
jgi:integrase/recombinase XerD